MILVLLQDTLSCLREFYYATDGPHWGTRYNWETSDDYCTFYGVTCEKNSTHIKDISFFNNKLSGYIPDCFSELEVDGVSFLYESISGPFPNVSSTLKTLDVYSNLFTSMPANWCDALRTTLRFSENPISQHGLSSCYLAYRYTNLTGLDITFSAGVVDTDGFSWLNAAGCNLSYVQLHFGDLSHAEYLDLSNTGAHSYNALNLSEAGVGLTFIELGGSHIYMVGGFPQFANYVDISGCYFDREFDFSIIPSSATYFVARDAGFVGFGPTVDEAMYFYLKTNYYFDFRDNAFFCKNGDAFSCIYLDIESVYVETYHVRVAFSSPKRINLTALQGKLSVAMKDFSNTNAEIQAVIDLANCSFTTESDYFVALCNKPYIAIPYTFDSVYDFAITYYGVQVSNGALNVFLEVREMIYNPPHDEFYDESYGFALPYIKEPWRYEFTCTAMSHCGDYVGFIKDALKPLYDSDPELMALLQYNYVSFSTPTPLYGYNATAPHGQLEVRDDKVLSCANVLLDDPTYIEFTNCYVQKYESYRCAYEVLGYGYAADVFMCAEEEALELIKSYVEQNEATQTAECPSVFMRRAGETSYSKLCAGYDCKSAKKLRKLICDFLGSEGADVC